MVSALSWAWPSRPHAQHVGCRSLGRGRPLTPALSPTLLPSRSRKSIYGAVFSSGPWLLATAWVSEFTFLMFCLFLVPSTPSPPDSKHPGTFHLKVPKNFLGMCGERSCQVEGHGRGRQGASVIKCAFQKGRCRSLPHLLQRPIPSGILGYVWL